MKRALEVAENAGRLESGDTNDADQDEEMSDIDVDFEFFDLNPKVDFHALNTLFKQLFGPDSILFEFGALADLFLEHPIGSTVKVDGEESDPYAVLTVLNVGTHQTHPQIKVLLDYILSKTRKDEKCNKLLTRLFATDQQLKKQQHQTGFLFSERLINMPVEVCPPLYRILSEEIASKCPTTSTADTAETAATTTTKDLGTEYNFDYYVLLTKTYTETASKLDDIEDDDGDGGANGTSALSRPKKKKKGKLTSAQGDKLARGGAGSSKKDTFYFHAEDELLMRHAAHHVSFTYTNETQAADSKRTFHEFGIRPVGEVVVLSRAGFAAAVAEIQQAYPF